MIRFEGEPPTEAPPISEEEECSDSLLERWLTRFPASQPRLRAVAAPERERREPIGDDLADSWFK
jgi:hypothetical protein